MSGVSTPAAATGIDKDALAYTASGERDFDDHVRSRPEVSDPSIRIDTQTASRSLLWHVRWTVPLHVVLPIGLWWLMLYDPEASVTAFLGIHAGFPFLLLVTMRWWWNSIGDLIVLLVINHLVSFAVLAFISW